MKNILLILMTLLVAAGALGGLYAAGLPPFAAASAAENAAPAAQAQAQAAPRYLALEPPFIVNFMHRGTLRYLQVSLNLTYPSDTLLSQVETRMPAIRNDLILLFSGQEFEQLNSREGKEKLRSDILATINAQIGLAPEAPQQGEVYFTDFVMQ